MRRECWYFVNRKTVKFLTLPMGIRTVMSTWRTMTNELRSRRGVPTSRMESWRITAATRMTRAWLPQVVGLSQVVILIISTLSADLVWGQVRSTWTRSFKRRMLVTTTSPGTISLKMQFQLDWLYALRSRSVQAAKALETRSLPSLRFRWIFITFVNRN